MYAAPITKPRAARRKRGTVNPQPLHVAQIAEALLILRNVCALTGLSPSSVYRRLARHDFPQPVRLGNRCTRWRAGDVTAWLAAQAEA